MTTHSHEAHEDMVMDEAWWDGRYQERDQIWSGNPNTQLVAEVSGLHPGTALDVGAGEGGDAIWLVEQGWRVTAVDLSSVALERAAKHAQERGAEVTWSHVDLTVTAPTEQFDLVTAHFVHMPTAEGLDLINRRMAAAVRPGGILLIVLHSPLDMDVLEGRPKIPHLYRTADQVASVLEPGDWEILVAEARPRSFQDVTIHDEVLKARRR
jgi:2-polyprenyl-3-methyl-5-hydroxy-6-metoxy-1,4-benzoquinol methylase